MKKLTILFLLVGVTAFSQKPIHTDLGTFKELKVFSGLTVNIQKAEKSHIEITGKKSSEVVVKNINGRLKISMKFPETFHGSEVNIKLFYANDLLLIDANEGATVGTKETIEQQSIEIKVQEGAIINIPVKAKYLTGKAVSGGQLFVNGSVESQDIELTTGGIYKGYKLSSNKTDITSSSGSIGQINVSKVLNAKVSLGGTIFYKGNPDDVTTKKIIGGTIESKE